MNLRRLQFRAVAVAVIASASLFMPREVEARGTGCLVCGSYEECPDWSTRDHVCFHAYGTYALNGCMAAVCGFDQMGWECSC